MKKLLSLVVLAGAICLTVGCEEKKSTSAPPKTMTSGAAPAGTGSGTGTAK